MRPALIPALFGLMLSPLNAGTTVQDISTTHNPPAQSFSYDFIEAGWVQRYSDGDILNGYQIQLSHSFTRNLFAFGSWDQSFGELTGTDLSFSVLQFGAGFHTAVLDNVDFVVTAAALRAEVDQDGFGSDGEWGFDITSGFRTRPMTKLELSVLYGFSYVDGQDQSRGIAAIAYELTDHVDVILQGTIYENGEMAILGARYYF